jgi:hypothetical protein
MCCCKLTELIKAGLRLGADALKYVVSCDTITKGEQLQKPQKWKTEDGSTKLHCAMNRSTHASELFAHSLE